MDFSHYKDLSVQMAVDLINTFDPVTRTEKLTCVADLQELLARYQRDWHAEDWHPGAPNDDDLVKIRSLRARLRRVFEAPDDGAAAVLINEILIEVEATPRISVHTKAPHLHFEPLAADMAAWLGAATAMGVGTALIDGGLERFGVCGSETCDDVFIDTSKNRSRKHCSVACTTRENVAAHRRRAKRARSSN